MSDPSLTDDDRDRLAAEYALGVIEPGDRAVASRLLLSDRSFADLVARWERDLATLHDEVAPVDPPAHLWDAIARRTHNVDARRVAGPGWWRVSSVGLGALAAALAVLLVQRPAPPAPPAPPPATRPAPLRLAVAQLSDPAGKPLIVAGMDRSTGRLRLRAVTLRDGDKAPELWVIPVGSTPHSLGLLNDGGLEDVTVPPGAAGLLSEGATLAVTMEPRGGAPHSAPTGSILASGPLTLL